MTGVQTCALPIFLICAREIVARCEGVWIIGAEGLLVVCQILREQINGRLQPARLPISIRETLPGGEGARMARAQGLFVIVEDLLEQGD